MNVAQVLSPLQSDRVNDCKQKTCSVRRPDPMSFSMKVVTLYIASCRQVTGANRKMLNDVNCTC